MSRLPRKPDPARLRRVGPDIRRLPAGTEVFRVYASNTHYPSGWSLFRAYGPTEARFDHHPERYEGSPAAHPGHGVLYGSPALDEYVHDEIQTCAAEFYQRDGVIKPWDRREPRLASFLLDREVAVLSLMGKWATRAGASGSLHSDGRKRITRRWARAIYDVYKEVQGILYPSSMNGGQPALVLYERAEDALPEYPEMNELLRERSVQSSLRVIAKELEYDFRERA